MADTQTNPAPAAFRIVKQRHSRYWEVRDPQDELVCITVYKKGAAEVVRRAGVRDETGAARRSAAPRCFGREAYPVSETYGRAAQPRARRRTQRRRRTHREARLVLAGHADQPP